MRKFFGLFGGDKVVATKEERRSITGAKGSEGRRTGYDKIKNDANATGTDSATGGGLPPSGYGT